MAAPNPMLPAFHYGGGGAYANHMHAMAAPASINAQFHSMSPHDDLRDAQAAREYWNGRACWGTRVEAQFLIPTEPVRQRTPYEHRRSEGSLRIELRPSASSPEPPSDSQLRELLAGFGELRSLDRLQEQSGGAFFTFVEYFNHRARLRAYDALLKAQFGDYTLRTDLAWDKSSIKIVRQLLNRSIVVPNHGSFWTSVPPPPLPMTPMGAPYMAHPMAALAQYQQQQYLAAMQAASSLSAAPNPMLLSPVVTQGIGGAGGPYPYPSPMYTPTAAAGPFEMPSQPYLMMSPMPNSGGGTNALQLYAAGLGPPGLPK
ncbi:hypothetical protein H9P43_002030 [Blastocladiella emersonii ATCC 22665]|nr:hypothetical protein H9P43_002030 [Blastocladiella emersonii ATCC 22665]